MAISMLCPTAIHAAVVCSKQSATAHSRSDSAGFCNLFLRFIAFRVFEAGVFEGEDGADLRVRPCVQAFFCRFMSMRSSSSFLR